VSAREQRFSRQTGVTWRDTGWHVVLLPAGTSEVTVLGGGAALVWRLLESPASAREVAGYVGPAEDSAPVLSDIEKCMRELEGRGLVRPGCAS
jgi:hypothetical protein